MPTEIARKWGKVPVVLPGGVTVDVRVATEVTFLDSVNRGQETTYTILNQLGDDQANRDVHVDTVTAQDGSGLTIDVERIDTFRVKDPVDRGQETFPTMDNTTGGDSEPPSFTTHLLTHTTRFYSDDQLSFVETEWIDEFIVKDPVDRGQETHYFVTGNPVDDDSSQSQPDDPDVSGNPMNGEGDGGDPVRTDWFQNIVDFKAILPQCFFAITNSGCSGFITGETESGIPVSDPNPNPAPSLPSDQTYDGSYVTAFSLTATSGCQLLLPSGLVTGPGPRVSLSQSSFAYGDFVYSNGQGTVLGSGIPITQLHRFDPGGGGPSGPPLVINGKTIPGFVATLNVTLTVSASPFLTGPGSFLTLPPVGTGSINWWTTTQAAVLAGNPTVPIDTYTLTVSATPFTFNGFEYKAVGLSEVSVGVPPFGLVVPGQPTPPQDVLIYIVRV